MIDVHCHLTDSRYTGTKAQRLIEEARAEGIQIITSGTGVEDSKKAIKLAEKYPNVWATVGVHPEETKYELRDTIYDLKELAKNSRVVGIGEIGLDYREGITELEKERQRELFGLQLELASELELPVVVHNRKADEDLYSILKTQATSLMGILLHCFTRNLEYMHKMSELGAYFSFGGMITYKNNQRMRNVVKMVPQDRLLLETDSPFSVPTGIENDINSPVNVKIVAERMAEIRGVAVNDIERITTANARRLFKLT